MFVMHVINQNRALSLDLLAKNLNKETENNGAKSGLNVAVLIFDE